MPFADWHRPSFALSQLAALTRLEFPDEADVEVHYLNQDFASYLGVPTYAAMAGDVDHLMTGMGDWLFRQIAFPGLRDNSEQYFNRYYLGPRWRSFRQQVMGIRDELEKFCVELIDRYHLDGADVIGFTSMFAQNVGSIAMARLIKERNKSAIIVFGGANCETPMGEIVAKNLACVDYVFSGPALKSFPEFLRCLIRGDTEAVRDIQGVLCHGAGRAGGRPPIGAERDIDDFFEPDYQSFVTSLTSKPDLVAAQTENTKPILYFETSRGCWWGARSHCTFCGLNGLTIDYRTMSPEVALRQFRWLFSFAPWCTNFHCVDNIMPKSYPRDVFPQLDRPPGATLFYEVKLPLSEKDLHALADAGVTYVQPGIEALSTETLQLMRKGTTAFHNLQFLKNCSRFGIDPAWNLLVGFPGESEQVYEKYAADIPLLVHLRPPTGAYLVRFDRYSPYFNQSAEYQLDLAPMDFYSLIYPFRPDDLGQIAYFFQDLNLSAYLANVAAWIGPLNDHITKWRRRWESGPPCLNLAPGQDGGWEIRDSRFGGLERMEIDEATRALLQRLSSPVRPADLPAELGMPADQVSQQLDFLRAHKLVFEENGRMLSLVVLDDLR
jgi:ribosomal peptide maturation radical SAM protein 1